MSLISTKPCCGQWFDSSHLKKPFERNKILRDQHFFPDRLWDLKRYPLVSLINAYFKSHFFYGSNFDPFHVGIIPTIYTAEIAIAQGSKVAARSFWFPNNMTKINKKSNFG